MATDVRIGSLCTGYGGLDMAAVSVFGGGLAWWSDIEAGPVKVMEHHHPEAPNIGDVKAVDWSSVEPVDVLTAGYPCQPFSIAGKGKGTDDPRHIWPWIAYGVAHLRPRYVVLENVAAHVRRGFDVVASDLAALGYDLAWSVVRASDVGLAHRRERLYIVAQDTNQQPGIEWWSSAPGEAEGGRPRADVGGRDLRDHVTANAYRAGLEGREPATGHLVSSGRDSVDWGKYAAAVERHAAVLGRPAPYPATRGPRGGLKVSPAFAEWLMGLPEGHITDVPGLSVNEQLKLAGNGVVPLQAEHAIRGLLPRLLEED